MQLNASPIITMDQLPCEAQATFDTVDCMHQSSAQRCDLPSLRSLCTVQPSSLSCSSPRCLPPPHSPFSMAAKAKTGSIAVRPSLLQFSILLPCRRVTPPISSSTCPRTPCTVSALLTDRDSLPKPSSFLNPKPVRFQILSGFPGPGDGVGDVSHNSWSNNMTSFVWTIASPFVTLNSTVYYTLNTSGRAPRGKTSVT